jgi:hypothetical protein
MCLMMVTNPVSSLGSVELIHSDVRVRSGCVYIFFPFRDFFGVCHNFVLYSYFKLLQTSALVFLESSLVPDLFVV